jgi:DNA-binding LacI/PurR family transcriptional regulator
MTTGSRPPRRATLADVAREAGVSVALASIVMRGAEGASEKSRATVKAAAAALGYRPDSRARALRSLRSGLLGVSLSLAEPFHAELVDAIYAASAQRGFDVVLSATGSRRTEAQSLESLADAGCEAIIAISPGGDPAALASVDAQLPLISLLRAVPAVDSVRTDDAEGIRQAVDHLVALGHRDIAHIDGGAAVAAAERRQAYRESMEGHGLGARVLPGGPDERSGTAAVALLQRTALPTAVVVFNDRCALGVLDALERAGVPVPESMSVVGFDDSQFARLAHIGLSSVRQDVEALAFSAVERAAARLDGEPAGLREHAPSLVLRGSTAGPSEVRA